MGTSLLFDLLLPLLPALEPVGRAADLVVEWLLTYTLHSTVLVGSAWALATLLRARWSPAAVAALWRTALVAGWVTSAVQIATPWRPMGGQWLVPRPARAALAAVRVEQADRTIPPAQERAAPTEIRRVVVIGVSLATVAVAGWMLVAALASMHLAWRRRRLGGALAGRHDAADSLAGNALRHLQRLAGVRRPVALSVTEALAVPAALRGDEIVLPLRAVHELSLAEQEAVLAHELAHVVRRDTAWLQLACWIERVAWFQPCNSLARHRMQHAAEFAADAWAARLTGQPLRLAQALARVASWQRAAAGSAGAVHAPFAAAMAANGSPLLDRVRRLTSPHGAPSATSAGALPVAAMGAAALAALLTLPQPRFQAHHASWAPARQHAALRLAASTRAPDEMSWREARGTTVRLAPPGAGRAGDSAATVRIEEVVQVMRRVPAPPNARGALPDSARALIIVRRGAGTAS